MKKKKKVYYGATPEEVIQFGMMHKDAKIILRGLNLKQRRRE